MFIVDPQTTHQHQHTPKSAEILYHGFFSCFQNLLRLVLIYLFCPPTLCLLLRFPFGIRAWLLMLASRSQAAFRQHFLAQNFLVISFQRGFWYLPVRPKCCEPWISDISGTHCCIRNTQRVRTNPLEEARHQSYLTHLFVLSFMTGSPSPSYRHSPTQHNVFPNENTTCHSLNTSCALELLSLYIDGKDFYTFFSFQGLLHVLQISSSDISSWEHSGLLTLRAGILIRDLPSVDPLFNNCFTFSSVFQIY